MVLIAIFLDALMGKRHTMIDIFERREKIKDDYWSELREKKRNKLIERRNRTRRNLAHALSILKSKPKWFIALSIDRNQYKKMQANYFSLIFSKFKTYIKNDYPEGWFIWKIEWKSDAQLHVHMIGNTKTKDIMEVFSTIKRRWDFCCKHKNEAFKSVDVQHYETDGAKGYFLEVAKRKDELTCITGVSQKWSIYYDNNL